QLKVDLSEDGTARRGAKRLGRKRLDGVVSRVKPVS
ncbi:hypothetical protein Tco_0557486, partial [Tanacetum coccineum]